MFSPASLPAPTSRRGWPSGIVRLQVWNDSYNAMVRCRPDYKNAVLHSAIADDGRSPDTSLDPEMVEGGS